jgi:hypothetical protein
MEDERVCIIAKKLERNPSSILLVFLFISCLDVEYA